MTLNGVRASMCHSDRDLLLRLYSGPSQPKSYHLGARGLMGWIPHLGQYVTNQDFSTAFWYLRGRDPAYTPRKSNREDRLDPVSVPRPEN